MIFDIIHPKDPEAQWVIFKEVDGSGDACDLIDLLYDERVGFGRMLPGLICHGGYENAVELSTDPYEYIAAGRQHIN